MNCKQIKEEIDASARHNPYSIAVRSHLSDCPDCHRYSDETASLTRLLGAQPRVEAPPDFEFRLRARLLRAQAAPEIDPQGFLWKILPGTFSWGHTVAAAAALTLAVTVSVLYVNRSAGTPEPGGSAIANKALNPQTNGAGPARETERPSVESVMATPVKFPARKKLATFRSESPASPNDVEGVDNSTPFYSPETKRLLKDRSVFYGAETASITSKPAGAALTF